MVQQACCALTYPKACSTPCERTFANPTLKVANRVDALFDNVCASSPEGRQALYGCQFGLGLGWL